MLLKAQFNGLAELFFAKKSIPVLKLTQNYVNFKTFLTKVNEQRIERRKKVMQ
jgi:hypothetical protein